MAYNYATENTGLYDQKIKQQSLTSELTTAKVSWLNAQSFIITTMETSGYQPHTRTKGYNSGTIENKKKVYTLGFDRDIEFFVDKADVDETARDLEASRVTGTFITENASPEIDAYRFSKLATAAIANGNSASETVTKSNVYSRLKASLLPIRKFGTQNIVIYVSSEVMDALEQSTEFTRQITVQNVGLTALESRVTSIDGVRIVEVFDIDRFATEFDFTNGFEKASTGKDINFLIVAKPAIVAQQKIASVYFFAPGEHTEGDGWLYQNRLYHDLWVLEQQKEGVYVSHKA